MGAGVQTVEGHVLSNGTFACAATMPPAFDLWLAWIEPMMGVFHAHGRSVRSGEAIAAVSLLLGLLCLIMHEVLINTTIETSVWRLEPAGPPRCPSEISASALHNELPLRRTQGRNIAVLELADVAQLNLVRQRQWRAVHIFAVSLFCTVDVLVNGTLYFEFKTTAMFVVPYGLVEVAFLAYLLLAGAIKTTLVAGWQRQQWLDAVPWVRITLAMPVCCCTCAMLAT